MFSSTFYLFWLCFSLFFIGLCGYWALTGTGVVAVHWICVGLHTCFATYWARQYFKSRQ